MFSLSQSFSKASYPLLSAMSHTLVKSTDNGTAVVTLPVSRQKLFLLALSEPKVKTDVYETCGGGGQAIHPGMVQETNTSVQPRVIKNLSII